MRTIIGVLDNKPGPARDIVMLNAGAAIYVAGLAGSLQEGIRKADQAIASGEARNRLDRLVVLTQSFDLIGTRRRTDGRREFCCGPGSLCPAGFAYICCMQVRLARDANA